MNYKKYIKSQRLRFIILRLLSWVPDSIMIRVQYRIKTGRWLNLKHPQRFTEKLQVYKLKYRNPLIQQCVDKYEVRHFIESKGLGYILNDLYGIYDKSTDIDFDCLPEQFVIKTTSGSGGLNVLIVTNKTNAIIRDIEQKVTQWRKNNSGQVNAGREWAYQGIKPRIIIEKYLEDEKGLIDYKFFCFNGDPKYLYVVTDRIMGESVALGVFDINFNQLPVYRSDERELTKKVEKPQNFEKMVEVVKVLSSDFPHVRADLYNINGRIIFGELTFYDGSGYFMYEPDDFDITAGEFFTEYN